MRELYYSYVFWAAESEYYSDVANVFLIGKGHSAVGGDCILSGASLPGSRAEVVILSGPSI